MPPPHLFVPPNDLFHYSFTINKARHIHNYGQDFINHISPLMGGPLCENNIWDCLYNTCYLTQTIWVSLFFRIWVVWYLFVVFINFRGLRDFINRRGLLIQGGDSLSLSL